MFSQPKVVQWVLYTKTSCEIRAYISTGAYENHFQASTNPVKGFVLLQLQKSKIKKMVYVAAHNNTFKPVIIYPLQI